jgi:diguanylate cyclase (GGDEF)-like protein
MSQIMTDDADDRAANPTIRHVAVSRTRRANWLSRFALGGLVLVLVVMSGLALWGTHAEARSARHAFNASRLSDHYDEAAHAVMNEESLERKYLQVRAPGADPSHGVRAQFDAAADSLAPAMLLVRRDGGAADQRRVDQVLAMNGPYLQAADHLFAAVDRNDLAAVTRIDRTETDPRFDAMNDIVIDAAEAQHARAQDSLAQLRRLNAFTSAATPIGLACGALLLMILAVIMGRARRTLHSHRERALHDSLHDPLTGLANRAQLANCFDEALRRGGPAGTTTGLLLLDLDRFKEVNDSLGHDYGDLLLTQIGPRLAGVLREQDIVARLGGDEFAVLLPEVASLDAAMLVAETLRYALTVPFTVYGLDLEVEASVGVVVRGEHGEDSSTLLQRADIAMYVAKNENIGVFAYDPSADEHSPEKLTLLSELRRALDRKELVLHYQPKIDLRTGAVCGAEALVRWQHPLHGLLPPDRFIPLAEHTGLIGPLTYYVLETAMVQAQAWLHAGHRIPIAVNLSARNLHDERLADHLGMLLERHALSTDLIEVEVTESAIMIEPIRAHTQLDRINELGVQIAIDDFGVGYTSLAELKTMPVGELKIDRSFVTNMDTETSNGFIVKSVIDLAHNLGLITVAEGVETAATMSALTRLGCDVAQGYHISRPLPIAGFDAWYLGYEPMLPDSSLSSTTR